MTRIASLTHILTHDMPGLQSFAKLIPYMSMSTRKALLTVCRCQVVPIKGSKMWKRMNEDLSRAIYDPDSRSHFYLKDLLPDLATEIQSPIFSGFISMLLRNLPFDPQDVMETFETTRAKEMAAALETYHPQQFFWSNILSHHPRTSNDKAIAPGYPITDEVYSRVSSAFRHSKSVLQSSWFFPDYSNKTIGRRATRNLSLICDHNDEYTYDNSTLGLEQLYCHRFCKVEGPTECRWAWKYNDLKPRVYYARGPDQYYASRYIQQVFNILIDSLPNTNRFTRFHHNLLRFSSDDTLFIYDYSSFTSTLHEIRNFTTQLARYFSDTHITIVDTHKGPMTVNLGDMLTEFNEACNLDPVFDTGILNWERVYSEELQRHNCGMLGVPGNISSCTLLHGIHLAVLLGSFACKVVGDDALGAGDIPEDVTDFVAQLSNIGDISISKTEWWRPDRELDGDILQTWHYTKRPINRLDTRVNVGWQAVFPSIAVMMDITDPYHSSTPYSGRYGHLKKVAGMLSSFSRQFSLDTLTESESQFCLRFLRIMAQETGLEDFKSISGQKLMYPRFLGTEGFEAMMFEFRFVAKWLPVRADPLLFDEFEVNRTVKGRMTKALKLAKDMGFAEATSMRSFRLVGQSELDLQDIVAGRFVTMYEYCVFLSCPDWLVDLIRLMSHGDSAVNAADGMYSEYDIEEEE